MFNGVDELLLHKKWTIYTLPYFNGLEFFFTWNQSREIAVSADEAVELVVDGFSYQVPVCLTGIDANAHTLKPYLGTTAMEVNLLHVEYLKRNSNCMTNVDVIWIDNNNIVFTNW